MTKQREADAHILCTRCHDSYGEAVARWADRGRANAFPRTLTDEAVCTSCHGRLEPGEAVVIVRWTGAANTRTEETSGVTP